MNPIQTYSFTAMIYILGRELWSCACHLDKGRMGGPWLMWILYQLSHQGSLIAPPSYTRWHRGQALSRASESRELKEGGIGFTVPTRNTGSLPVVCYFDICECHSRGIPNIYAKVPLISFCVFWLTVSICTKMSELLSSAKCLLEERTT